MVKTYRDFVEKRLDLKVPNLLLRIVGGIQEVRSHKGEACTGSTMRAWKTATSMLHVFYLRRLLSSDAGEQQLSMQPAAWTQTLNTHPEIRGWTSIVLRDMLSRSPLDEAQGVCPEACQPWRAASKEVSVGDDQK